MRHEISQAILDLAVAVAHEAHAGQTRNDRITPAITHPLAVMGRVSGNLAKAVAVLHDVLEDNPAYTAEHLLQVGLPDVVVEPVLILTKQRRHSYEFYIGEIAKHPVARRVKIEDNLVNLADHPSDRAILKYIRSLRLLRAKAAGVSLPHHLARENYYA